MESIGESLETVRLETVKGQCDTFKARLQVATIALEKHQQQRVTVVVLGIRHEISVQDREGSHLPFTVPGYVPISGCRPSAV